MIGISERTSRVSPNVPRTRESARASVTVADVETDEETYPRAAPDVPPPAADDDPDAQADDDPNVLSARSEIHGLMERVRGISSQLRRQQG